MLLRIIIADDHHVARIGIQVVIESSGAGRIVAQANAPGELLQALQHHPCDILITDLSMPDPTEPDGVAMLQQIRSRYPQLPIILLTATRNLALLRQAHTAGAKGLLDKTSSLQELPQAIRAVTRNQTYIGTGIHQRCEQLGGSTCLSAPTKPLSTREQQVLRMLAEGMSLAQIARCIKRRRNTVSRQKIEAMRKLGVVNDMELMTLLRKR